MKLKQQLKLIEKQIILNHLTTYTHKRSNKPNISKIARKLGISKSCLIYKLQEYSTNNDQSQTTTTLPETVDL